MFGIGVKITENTGITSAYPASLIKCFLYLNQLRFKTKIAFDVN